MVFAGPYFDPGQICFAAAGPVAFVDPVSADLAFADFAHPNNPKPVSREDFKILYRKAL